MPLNADVKVLLLQIHISAGEDPVMTQTTDELGGKVNTDYVPEQGVWGAGGGRALEMHLRHTPSKTHHLHQEVEARRNSSFSPPTATLERVLKGFQNKDNTRVGKPAVTTAALPLKRIKFLTLT